MLRQIDIQVVAIDSVQNGNHIVAESYQQRIIFPYQPVSVKPDVHDPPAITVAADCIVDYVEWLEVIGNFVIVQESVRIVEQYPASHLAYPGSLQFIFGFALDLPSVVAQHYPVKIPVHMLYPYVAKKIYFQILRRPQESIYDIPEYKIIPALFVKV